MFSGAVDVKTQTPATPAPVARPPVVQATAQKVTPQTLTPQVAPPARTAPPAKAAPAASNDDDDETVEEDYSLFQIKEKPRTAQRSRPAVVSPNARAANPNGLLSPGRLVAQGHRLPPARPISRGHSHGDGHNHSHDEEDEDSEGKPPCIGCGERTKKTGRYIDVAAMGRVQSTSSNMRSAVWNTFARTFSQCAPGCQPAQVGVFRDSGGRSCHDSGRAIDLGAMICGGRVYKAINGGRFSQMVSCMRPKMKTLYQEGHKRHAGVTLAHYDHAHFSIGCHGGTYW